MRLLLICHAEDMHDLYDYLGNESSGLTAQGWEQADVLATWLRSHELVDVLVSDNLLQCRLTAQRVGQAMSLSVTVVRDLPNCTPPVWSEVNGEGSRALSATLPLAEASPAQINALVAGLDKVIAEHWGSTVAIVTCAPNIVGLLRRLSGSQSLDIQISHTGITELAFGHGRWRISCVNGCPHLPAPIVTPRHPREDVQTPEETEDLSTIVDVYDRVSLVDLSRKRHDDAHRLRHLLNFAKLPADVRVLDIGSGIGLLPVLLAEDGARQVIGIDISPAMLEQAEYLRLSRPGAAASNASFRLAPGHALPFRDDFFDAVTCRLVLNHVRRADRILKEIARVLRPGGYLILAELLGVDNPVKRATQNAIEERRNPAHVAARGLEQYNKLLTEAGLTIEAKEVVSFDRELEEWLSIYGPDKADAAAVREMIEAGLETDAAGINARRQNSTLVFDQRMYYVKAVKPAARG